MLLYDNLIITSRRGHLRSGLKGTRLVSASCKINDPLRRCWNWTDLTPFTVHLDNSKACQPLQRARDIGLSSTGALSNFSNVRRMLPHQKFEQSERFGGEHL